MPQPNAAPPVVPVCPTPPAAPAVPRAKFVATMLPDTFKVAPAALKTPPPRPLLPAAPAPPAVPCQMMSPKRVSDPALRTLPPCVPAVAEGLTWALPLTRVRLLMLTTAPGEVMSKTRLLLLPLTARALAPGPLMVIEALIANSPWVSWITPATLLLSKEMVLPGLALAWPMAKRRSPESGPELVPASPGRLTTK